MLSGGRTVPRLLRSTALVLVLLTCAAGTAPSARAGEAAPAPSPAAVRSALKAFGRAAKSRQAGERIEAVRTLATVPHEKCAKRLLTFVRREQDPEVLAAAFEALRGLDAFATLIVPELARRIEQEAEAERERMQGGDPGLRIDPRSGEPDVTSAEGRAVLQRTQLRGRMLAALMQALGTLGWQPGKRPPRLESLLQDPCDDLVVAVLEWMGRHGMRSALPSVLALYRMYPTDASWETGAVVDLAGTDASAKAKWMLLYGHPDKQRARPRVVAALQAMLEQVTGRQLETPEALAAWMSTQETPPARRSSRRR